MSSNSSDEEDVGFLPSWHTYAGGSSPIQPSENTLQFSSIAYTTLYPGLEPPPPPPPPPPQPSHEDNTDGGILDAIASAPILSVGYDDLGDDSEDDQDMTHDSKFDWTFLCQCHRHVLGPAGQQCLVLAFNFFLHHPLPDLLHQLSFSQSSSNIFARLDSGLLEDTSRIMSETDEPGIEFENHTGEPYDSAWNYWIDGIYTTIEEDETLPGSQRPDISTTMEEDEAPPGAQGPNVSSGNTLWDSMTNDSSVCTLDYEQNLNIASFFKRWDRWHSNGGILEKIQPVASRLSTIDRPTYITRKDLENGAYCNSEQGIPWEELGTSPAIAKDFRRRSYKNYLHYHHSDTDRVSGIKL
jgi:hypothetical protein